MTNPLPPIVSAPWLTDCLATGTAPTATGEHPLKLADVRSYLDGRSGPAAYAEGHLPGAVFISMDEVLAGPATAGEGRHPLPPPEVFAAGLGRAGIGEGDAVVVYDDLNGMVAGRLVWMLRVLGLPAALLDGGLTAWPGPVTTEVPTPEPVSRPVRPWPADATAGIDEVATVASGDGLVVDCRAAARFEGAEEPVDPRAGHVPGAINLPFPANLDPEGRFRPADELAARFGEVGAGADTIMYCGSGVSACHNILAMEHAGLDRPRLYVGSWSQWSSDPARPAATGTS